MQEKEERANLSLKGSQMGELDQDDVKPLREQHLDGYARKQNLRQSWDEA